MRFWPPKLSVARSGILILGFILPLHSATFIPHFLITNSDTSTGDLRRHFLTSGIFIRQEAAGRILIVDSPKPLSKNELGGLQDIYTGPVPLHLLKPMGPIGIAAGIKWNRRLQGSTGSLTGPGTQSVNGGAPLDPPPSLTVGFDGSDWNVRWPAVYGSAYYHVQIGADLESRISEPSIRLPHPGGIGGDITFRVRAVGENSAKSPWTEKMISGPAPLARSQTLPVPTLLSPAEGESIEGFNVILEFGPFGNRAWLQVDTDPSFNSPDVNIVLTNGEWAVPSALLKLGETYHWRVRAWGDPISGWTESRSFRIVEPRHIGSDVFINPEAPR